MKKSKFGFSFIEILVVVGIIGVLVAILLPRTATLRETALEKANIENGKAIIAALQTFYLANDSYPYMTPVADQAIGHLLQDATWLDDAGVESYDTNGTKPFSSYFSDANLINPYTGATYQSSSDAVSGDGDISLDITTGGGSNGEDQIRVIVNGRYDSTALSHDILKTFTLGADY